jgi:uncharacterized membrane protein (UPF0127 family)
MARPLPWGLEQSKKRGPWVPLLILVLVLLTLGVVVYLLGPSFQEESNACAEGNVAPSEVNVQLLASSERRFNVEYAKTPLQRELGLSDRPCFPDDAALLFLFPGDDKYGIWMKDMNFPIDVVWLDKDKKVVTIEKNMPPASYPKIYYPSGEARYVLEFNAGTADKLNVQKDTVFNW